MPAILNDISFESTEWIGAVVDFDLEVDHRVAGQDATRRRFLDALVHGGNELGRDRAAHDLVDDL
jgi:hypothetical protein